MNQKTHLTFIKDGWKSTVVVVKPTDTAKAISATVKSQLDKTENDEVIVVGYGHPTLPAAVDIFSDERLQWWNLNEKESQSYEAAKKYGTVMLSRDRTPTVMDVD